MQIFGQQALLAICLHLVCIALTWWALQGMQFEQLMKKGKTMQMKVLLILVTIAIGSSVSNFFLDYLGYSNRLTYLFE